MHGEPDPGQQEIDRLLAHLDDPPPRLHAEQVIDAARARRPARARWAAGVLLALGFAGAAYAAPASPLPAWIAAAREWAVRTAGRSTDGGSGVEPLPLAPPPADPSGIAVEPGDALSVVFEATQVTGGVTVTLTDGDEVLVRASAGAPAFSTGLDRLTIGNRGSTADFDVDIPRSAARVEVRVGSRRVFLSERGRVTTDAPIGASGGYTLLWPDG